MRALNVGHVKFAAKVDETLFAELDMQAQKAEVQWAEAVTIIDCELNEICRKAAHALLVDMARNWTPDQWRAAKKAFV